MHDPACRENCNLERSNLTSAVAVIMIASALTSNHDNSDVTDLNGKVFIDNEATLFQQVRDTTRKGRVELFAWTLRMLKLQSVDVASVAKEWSSIVLELVSQRAKPTQKNLDM